jgi:hypothetical protein
MTNMPEPITTRTAKISLRDDGIIQTIINLPNGRETVADAQTNIAAVTALSPEKKRPMLVDMRAVDGIEREVRAYYSSMEVSTARALLVESLVGQVIANFFIGLNKPKVPTRLFVSEAEAVAWLKSFDD